MEARRLGSVERLDFDASEPVVRSSEALSGDVRPPLASAAAPPPMRRLRLRERDVDVPLRVGGSSSLATWTFCHFAWRRSDSTPAAAFPSIAEWPLSSRGATPPVMRSALRSGCDARCGVKLASVVRDASTSAAVQELTRPASDGCSSAVSSSSIAS